MYMYIAIYSYIKNAEYAHRRVFSANRVAAKGSLRSPRVKLRRMKRRRMGLHVRVALISWLRGPFLGPRNALNTSR